MSITKNNLWCSAAVTAIVLLSMFALTTGADNDQRFADGEAQQYLSTSGEVNMLVNGYRAHSMSVGNDGEILVFSYYLEDITNPHLKQVTNLSGVPQIQAIKAPDGFKNSPILLGAPGGVGQSNRMLCVFAPKRFVHGIYMKELNKNVDFSLWQKGDYTELAVNYQETMLAYIKTRDPRPPLRELWIQPINQRAEKQGEPYRLATELRGSISNPIFSVDGKRIYFIFISADPTKSSLMSTYSVVNERGAKAVMIDSLFAADAAVWNVDGQPVSGDMLVGGRIRYDEGLAICTSIKELLRFDQEERNTLISVREPDQSGLSVSTLACNPKNGNLYFTAGAYWSTGTKNGIFVLLRMIDRYKTGRE